ncbi:uncharacterized protein BDZ99DRAFT_465022 [Mytilinidion resinicola]|uniref:MYND-type domain-containing protein n=1 Tax=Mytilinidion resinicola TaxID=574789 RepID=A0A6A6YEQ4_9PEZI|nr:uncharacterized protein BDZ99DRAFT_465022 [Mytilinidion resinicola]KAF2807089.1 hypothetical protein BDZ99DRAFT_465022 [Mytilinidion resinicola]
MSDATRPLPDGLRRLMMDRSSARASTTPASTIPASIAPAVEETTTSSTDDSHCCDTTPPDLDPHYPFVGPESFNSDIDFQTHIGSSYSWSPTGDIFATGCQLCRKPDSKECRQCKAVRYCGTGCQKIMWRKEHKENCGKNFADRLESILRTGEPLWYSNIYRVFGFSKATTGGDAERLRQLYLELLDAKELNITTEDLLKWRSKRIMKEKVQAACELLLADPDCKPRFSAWFIKNTHLLDVETKEHDAHLTAWRGLHLPKVQSQQQYAAITSAWTNTEARCYMMFYKLFYGMAPDVTDETYRYFAFCVCNMTQHPNIADLGKLYVDLMKKCNFRQFVQAIDNNSQHPKPGNEPGLVTLFKSKGLGGPLQRFPHIETVLFSREFHQAVWYLKQYIISKEENLRPDGFFGYKRLMPEDADETLTAIYYEYLVKKGRDPMALHGASVDDTLYECVHAVLPKLDPKCEELMRNGVKRVRGVETKFCGCVDSYRFSDEDVFHPMIPANHGLVLGEL